MTADEFINHYVHSNKTHSLEHTIELIDDNAIYWFSDKTCHVGKKAISQAIKNNFSTIKDETYTISDLTWIVKSSDIAVCTYNYKWSGLISGENRSGGGRGTSVLTKNNNKWLIKHEHLSKGSHK